MILWDYVIIIEEVRDCTAVVHMKITGAFDAVASLVLSGPMRTCTMIAPTLPLAAESPWGVDLYLVGKHLPGTKKVVVLGPNLKKN